MSYLTTDGKEIETVAIDVLETEKIFGHFSKKIPLEYLRVLDELEYAVISAGKNIKTKMEE